MRHVLLALSLALGSSYATASTVHSMPVDSPYVGLSASDTICFRVGDIMRATDSLWAAVDHRERLRIAAMVIAGLDAELEKALIREAAQRDRAAAAEAMVSGAVAGKEEAERDAQFWRKKANGRGWRAFFAGLVLGGGLGYGANELKP